MGVSAALLIVRVVVVVQQSGISSHGDVALLKKILMKDCDSANKHARAHPRRDGLLLSKKGCQKG